MSLRPRQPGMARLARAQGRMAPGGRRWSESPIPRPGHRRHLITGAPSTPPTAFSFLAEQTSTAAIPDVDFTAGQTWWHSADGIERLGSELPAGDPAVVVIWSHNNPDVVIPGDWTLVDSGQAGALYWWVAWTVVATGTTWVFPTGLATGWETGPDGLTGAVLMSWSGATGAPAPQFTTVNECAAGNAVTVAQPGAGWLLPRQLVLTVGPASGDIHLRPDASWATAHAWASGLFIGSGQDIDLYDAQNTFALDGTTVDTWTSDALGAGYWDGTGDPPTAETYDAISLAVGWLA